MDKKREIWVDDIKVLACVLVVIGHLYRSMVESGLTPSNFLYEWFDWTLYTFHVQLFFVCSGYIYQKYSCVNNAVSWWKNVKKKALALVVPYFTFSFVTWALKTVFSDAVNSQAGGLFQALFTAPLNQMWYLYTLFLIFLVTPTLQSRASAIICFAAALIAKFANLLGAGWGVFAVSSLFQDEIWFVLGMLLCLSGRKTLKMPISVGVGCVFLGLGVLVCTINIENEWFAFPVGATVCAAVIGIICGIDDKRERQTPLFAFLIKYTFPIYVMHTIFAASFRAVLFKIGIESLGIHLICGLIVSFIGPIIAAEIMERVRFLEFFLYPQKYIKIK